MREYDLGQGVVCVMKKSRRARRLRIVVARDGSVRVTLPLFVSYRYGKDFIESQATWIRHKKKTATHRSPSLLDRGDDNEYRMKRETARQVVTKRVYHFTKVYAVSWQRISIRNQKTRWGSCSRRGGLSFNYRLLFLPPHLRDYVIVHELCHLLEFNHSPHFWQLVAKAFPDYKELRRELRLL